MQHTVLLFFHYISLHATVLRFLDADKQCVTKYHEYPNYKEVFYLQFRNHYPSEIRTYNNGCVEFKIHYDT